MASVEQLLNEAQYAFQSINSGESRDNRRNASRARSLCRKIIRKFPTSTEAVSAHSVLKRLGDEAFSPGHSSQSHDGAKHTPFKVSSAAPQQRRSQIDGSVDLDWSGLLLLVWNAPKVVVAAVGFLAFVLFGILGPFFLLPLIAFVLFTGPFKQQLQPEQLQKVDEFTSRINAYIAERRKTGG